MSVFSSPFAYFVFLEWSFFTLAMITYIAVYQLAAWKDFFMQM